MKKQFSIFVIVMCVVYLALVAMHVQTGIDIYTFYKMNIRSYFFMAFITMGGFLLSLKTFIVINIKKELYDCDQYKKRFAENKEINPDLKLYGPLIRLGNFLIYCVIFSILTSVSQLTIGLIPNSYASMFCIALACGTVVWVFQAWWEIKQSLSSWFDILKDS